MGLSIGIDLGGTKIESILLDRDGREHFRKRIPTQQEEGYNSILERVCSLIQETAQNAGGQENVDGIGIGIPGINDASTGRIINANTTCMIGHPFASDTGKRIGRPVVIENDANCFTLAEARSGAAKGYELVFGVIMGTGCGGGLCLDGHVRHGPHGICGEWGHVSVDPGGLDCFCGKKGCIETKISGSGMQRSFEKTYDRAVKMHEIVEGSRRGDRQCAEAMDRFLDDFGRALGGLISILDPDAVVLGGGLSNIEELYTTGIERVKKYAFHPSLRTPILKNQLGDSAGVIGAAWLGAG